MGEGKEYVQNILYEILKINVHVIFVNMDILMLLFFLIHENEYLSIICVLSLVSFPVTYHFIGYYIFVKALFISTLNNLLLAYSSTSFHVYFRSCMLRTIFLGMTTAVVLVAEGLCVPG